MPFSRAEGVVDPEDLAMLRGVFDDALQSHAAPLTDVEQAELAFELLVRFRDGITDREGLLQCAVSRLRRVAA